MYVTSIEITLFVKPKTSMNEIVSLPGCFYMISMYRHTIEK